MEESFPLEQALHALESSDESERLYAVEDIGFRRIPETASALAKRLVTEDSQIVKDALVFTLKNMNAMCAYDTIFSMFTLPDAYLRNAAVSIFGNDGDDSIAYLTARLDHADKEVRKLILDSMVGIGTPHALMAIRAALHDKSSNVQITAVEYLGRLSDRESIEEMTSLFKEETEPMLRVSIIEAVLAMGDFVAARGLVSILVPKGSDTKIDSFFLPQVIELAARVGDVDNLVTLIRSLEDLPAYAEDIIYALEQVIGRGNKSGGETEVFDILVKLVSDPSVRADLRIAGLKLLRDTGRIEARDFIKTNSVQSKNKELGQFCAELLSEPIEK